MRRATSGRRTLGMLDFFYVLLGLALFGAAVAYASACDSL